MIKTFSFETDCYHEDRSYENGEETVSPNPCKRCFCKGKLNFNPITYTLMINIIYFM